MSDKKIDISNTYRIEIDEIAQKLKELESGSIYELTRVTSDGYLSTNIKQLRSMLKGLIKKIEYEKISDEETLGDEIFKK